MNSILPVTGLRKWLGRASSCQSARPLVKLETRTTTRRTLRKGEKLVCIRGRVWITSDRGVSDIILKKGESYEASRRDTIVIEALEDSMLRWIQ